MKRVYMFISFLLIILLACPTFAGCQNTAVSAGVSLKQSVENKLKVGDIGVVELDENPTTGFTWHYKIDNENVLKLDSDKYISPKTNAVGAGGTHVWNFKASGRGSAKILFEYYREWEKDKKPEKSFEYTVTVE